MQKSVLILSFGDDFHALAIQALLKKHDADADIVDTGEFPAAISLAHQGQAFTEVLLNGKPLSDYHSIWNRRARRPRASSDIPNQEEAAFAARECEQALWGAFYASGLPIYNLPHFELAANRKPYQLKLAHELGLRIPDTLITSSEEAARAFAQKHPRVIYKTFSGTDLLMTDTRPLSEEDLSDLWRLKYAPVIFQEYLELAREYRVTVVEGDCFVGEIKIVNPKAEYDWRLDDTHQILPAELPETILAPLRLLTKRLGLNSGSIDLRETPDGTIYFLEINPSGQFLFLDIFGGIDVSHRFCQMLLQ